ncbi:MAG: hypothetical protein VB048_01260 [Bacteroidaceae bacterium]|nr:hypothetical protein [Bacteroidaceae bacterium]
MKRNNVQRKSIRIKDLLVNSNNKRFIKPVNSEIDAIIEMFNIKNGNPSSEMFNLAKDISQNNLNSFEIPIVWYDKKQKKYIVIEGNRRISCIKIMTQYKNNITLEKNLNFVGKFWELNYDPNSSIECSVYSNYDDANALLPKIHQDLNGGIGRKQWGAHEKQQYKAEIGELTKTYAIIDFIKSHNLATQELKKEMDTTNWTSKLERVISFSDFKKHFHITFDDKNKLKYTNTSDQTFKMLKYLVEDLIKKPAIRTKEDFKKYCDNLPEEFKNQITSPTIKETKKDFNQNLPAPINIKKSTRNKQEQALGFTHTYTEEEKQCLDKKGHAILNELLSLNVNEYPYAAASLCRVIIEYTLGYWCKHFSLTEQENNLLGTFNMVINRLKQEDIIDSKIHTTLHSSANGEHFIQNLNTWMHSNNLQCVRIETLKNSWIACGIIVEMYIKFKNKIK